MAEKQVNSANGWGLSTSVASGYLLGQRLASSGASRVSNCKFEKSVMFIASSNGARTPPLQATRQRLPSIANNKSPDCDQSAQSLLPILSSSFSFRITECSVRYQGPFRSFTPVIVISSEYRFGHFGLRFRHLIGGVNSIQTRAPKSSFVWVG